MRKAIVFILFLSLHFSGYSQEIRAIEFNGLKKTNEQLLHRFLESKVGAEYDTVQVQEDVQSLLNLGYFVAVKDSAFSLDEEGIQLVFYCEEVISLLPILLAGSVGSDHFIKVGVRNLNLWGRGGVMKVAYQYQDGHSYFFNTTIPYVKQSNFGISIDAKRFASIEPIFMEEQKMVYDYFNNSILFGGFYEFEMFHRLHLIGILQKERFELQEDYMGQLNENFKEELINNGAGLRLLHEYAKLDRFGAIIEGFKLRNFFQTLYLGNTRQPFYHFVSESSLYKRLTEKDDLAFRFKLGLTSNNFGYFAPFTLDSYANIRGVGNKIDRGTGQMVLNTEYRYNIKSTSFGCYQIVGFLDWGSWRHPNGSLNDFLDRKNMRLFQGIGGRVFFKKLSNLVLRVDFGYDVAKPKNNGLVFGFGQYF